MSSVLDALLAQTAVTRVSESPLFKVLPVLAIGVVFYFLLIRPQRQQAKAHDKLVRGLKRGDQVVTRAGLVGTIQLVEDRVVTLDVGAGSKMRIDKAYVVGIWVEHPVVTPGK